MLQGGVQLDWDVSANDKIGLQQNIYKSDPNPDGGDTSVMANGGSIIARWEHIISSKSVFQLQAYYDHTYRNFGNGFTEDLKTYDLEWHHRYQIGARNEFSYGLNVRLMDHVVTNLELFNFLPANKKLYNYNVFVQDEIRLFDDRLQLTIGTKAGKNNYTGFEYQPNIRITWKASKTQTIWGAVSRAVRTPARIDRDFHLYLAPNLALISASNMRSENVIAYELGWRLQPIENLSISLATFYNRYDNLRSVEPGPPPLNIPFTFGNGVKGNSYGGELSATWQVYKSWQLRGGYTVFDKKMSVKSNSMDLNKGSAEANDPGYQFLIQSMVDFSRKIEWGTIIRYIGKLSKPQVKAYAGLDVRIGWKITNVFEVNLVGQNLLYDQHLEFIPSSPSPREIKRGIFGKLVCRL
jgi:iron complex outermembrane receptor protein